MSVDDVSKPGLRERKKIKTRALIQEHAIRLFREQGYSATTIEQIAEAADISPSTFFRYFPTKEAVVLEDDYDPLLLQAIRDQPAELSPLQALRHAMITGFANIPDSERDVLWERMHLSMSIPELRAASLQQLSQSIHMIAGIIAERVGRSNEDLDVRVFAGAVAGTMISVAEYCFSHPEANFLTVIDQALAHLEDGLSL